MNKSYEFFFEKLATEDLGKAGPLRKALLWAILNPTKAVLGTASVGAAAYLIPKLIWARERAKQNDLMRVNNSLVADSAANTYRMAEMMAGKPKPNKDNYNYVF